MSTGTPDCDDASAGVSQDKPPAGELTSSAAQPVDLEPGPVGTAATHFVPAGEAPFRRLHTATFWVPCCDAVLAVVVPAFFAGFFVGPWNVAAFLLVFYLVPVAVFQAIQYLTLRFRVNDEELFVESGIVFRRERRIPLDRIQEFEIRQGVVHRLCGLYRAEIKTAGSDSLEVSLNVLSKVDADALRETIIADDQFRSEADSGGEAETQCIHRLSIRDLALGGLTSNLIASLGALIGAVLYFQLFVSVGSGWLRTIGHRTHVPSQAVSQLYNHFGPQPGGTSDMAFDLIFRDTLSKSVVLVLVGLLFSVGTYVVRYYGFRLTRRERILEKVHGLLTHRTSSLNCNRVQALKIEEGLLRRCCRLAAIRVDSAGDRNEINEAKKRDVFVPIVRRGAALALASQTIPGLVNREPHWSKVSRRAIMRGSKKGWLLVGLLMLSTYSPLGWVCLMWLPAFPFVYYLNYQWYRNTGYYLDDGFLISRKGWLNRETLFLPIRNVQNVVLSQSFLERRAALATLSVDTAGQSNTGGGPVIRNLPLNVADRIQRFLVLRAAAVQPVV